MIRFIYSPYSSSTKPKITLIKNEDIEKKHVIKGHAAYELHTKIMTTPIEQRQILLNQKWEELIKPDEQIEESLIVDEPTM